MPSSGLIDERELLFHVEQKVYSKNNISEIYFTGPNPLGFSIPDTSFYGINKNGKISYYLSQNIVSWPASDTLSHPNPEWQGYDTTFIGPECQLVYFCMSETFYGVDSLAYDKNGRLVYIRYFSRQTFNFYNKKGLLLEQRVEDYAPHIPTLSTHKAFYQYDKNDRLTEINYAYGRHPKSGVMSPGQDIFNFFNYEIEFKKLLSYTSNGRLKSITYLSLDTVKKDFVPYLIIKHEYEKKLLSGIISIELPSNEKTYEEKVGYKFYK